METLTDHRHGGRRALALAFLAAIIEGFDLQAAGVVVPKLAPVFDLGPQQIGLFFSSATFGLIFGALAGGRIADKWGRRAGLLLALLTFGVFSIATAFTTSFDQLLVMRFLTGVGLGGALPNLVNIAAESTTQENRGKAVAIMYAGIPLGGGSAAVVSMLGLWGDNWQVLFLIGGILPLLLSPFIHFGLPPLAVVKAEVASAKGTFAKVFAPGTVSVTLALWMSFFLGLLVFYLLLNWMPQLMVTRGLDRSQASTVQIMFNIGGIIGSLTGGRLLDRKRPMGPVALCFVAAAAALLILGIMPAALVMMMLGGLLVGIAFHAVQTVLYGIAPQCYPFEVRGTGVGTAVAVGRLGSIAGPLLAGVLVAAGFTPTNLMVVLVPITLTAGLFTLLLINRRRAAAARTAANA